MKQRISSNTVIPKIKFQFTGKKLTTNAGLLPIRRFIEKLGLIELLDEKLTVERGNNIQHPTSYAVLLVLFGIFAGAKHMSHMVVVSTDSVLTKIFNWTKIPHESTLSRIFKRFSYRNIVELANIEGSARSLVWEKKWFGKVTLDLDSTVKGVYGNQEGANKGYNPHKKGQKSYHPLLCFIAETRECLHHWFRDGSAYTSNGAVFFMSECLSRLPKRVWTVFVRGDSGFFNGELMDLLENKCCYYLFKVNLKNLQVLLLQQGKWRKCKGFETVEFYHKCAGWKQSRRFVAVRTLTGIKTEGFLLPVKEYDYFCYVTNLQFTPLAIHSCYKKRATSENWIEVVKNQVYGGTILTNSFWANSALFAISILSYNLLVWMRWLTDKVSWHEEVSTFRLWFIRLAGKLVCSARQVFIKLPRNYLWQERWEQISQKVEELQFY